MERCEVSAVTSQQLRSRETSLSFGLQPSPSSSALQGTSSMRAAKKHLYRPPVAAASHQGALTLADTRNSFHDGVLVLLFVTLGFSYLRASAGSLVPDRLTELRA